MKTSQKRSLSRVRRHTKIRSKVAGTSTLPRLCVFRSNTFMYAQLIDDLAGKTLASASDMKIKKGTKGTKTERATAVGKEIAQKALALKLSKIVFDRGGYIYHGRVKALAEGAREGGLQF
jgi:large subunit ribosomal protein L18